MKRIYLDHAATTCICDDALNAMLPYFKESFGNPDSLHSFGRESAFAVSTSREKIAKILGAKQAEIYFTSGGSESDNWAIRGMAARKGRHIISSAIEHPAVKETLKELEKQGVKITILPVNDRGFVEPESLEKVIDKDVSLVSVMLANNETGVIQPIKELAKIAHNHGVAFHTDAVQAVGSIDVNVKDLGVDMLSFSAHKFYGPKGVGGLFVRSGLRPDKLISGGHQERTMRGGTSNTPLIVGMAAALEYVTINKVERVKNLRDEFESLVEKNIPNIKFNGDRQNRLPGTSNISFEFIEGEGILMMLDLAGIACSTGSACSSGSLEPSHVLLSMGVPIELAHGSIRFSFGRENTMEDVKITVEKLKDIVEKLRKMSPLFLQLSTTPQMV